MRSESRPRIAPRPPSPPPRRSGPLGRPRRGFSRFGFRRPRRPGAGRADGRFRVAHPVAHLEFQHGALAVFVELEGAVEGVGRLLVVVEHEVAADGGRLHGILHAQSPARHVHLVDALVAQVAVAVIPEPVPVVVEAVHGELALGRRTGPQVVVHPGRNLRNRRAADGVAPLEA